MTGHVMDWERIARTGLPEAVLCEGKSVDQIAAILTEGAGRPLLLTRLSETDATTLQAGDHSLDYDAISRTAIVGAVRQAEPRGVVIVMAGTADRPTGEEAARTLAFNGVAATMIADVGVAGLWRLMARVAELQSARVVIAVAGMEGALFSVLGGLVAAPIIACPSPVGYGVGAGGQTALMSALTSCADGVTVANIGNGYGAACAALRILNIADQNP